DLPADVRRLAETPASGIGQRTGIVVMPMRVSVGRGVVVRDVAGGKVIRREVTGRQIACRRRAAAFAFLAEELAITQAQQALVHAQAVGTRSEDFRSAARRA